MSDYLFGLATLPAALVVAAAVYGLGLAIHNGFKRWWQRLSPTVIGTSSASRRIPHVAALMVARRFVVIRAPFGRVIVYRSRFTSADTPARHKVELDRYTDAVRGALTAAMKEAPDGR